MLLELLLEVLLELLLEVLLELLLEVLLELLLEVLFLVVRVILDDDDDACCNSLIGIVSNQIMLAFRAVSFDTYVLYPLDPSKSVPS